MCPLIGSMQCLPRPGCYERRKYLTVFDEFSLNWTKLDSVLELGNNDLEESNFQYLFLY